LDGESISWHPGFYDMIQEEFDKYGDALDFKAEYQLSKEPLRIDVVVIKKPPGIVIDKNIGRIFRGHNIFEYKSPTDYVSVEDFKKVCAYAWLYSAETGAAMDDLTLSFVTAASPRALFGYCRSLGFAVEKRWGGVYYVTGCFVPVQVIVNGELDGGENLWLRNYRDDISVRDLKVILDETTKRGNAKKLQAYLYAILTANAETLKEVRDMRLSRELRDVICEIGLFDDALLERERAGVEEGKLEGKLEGAVLVLRLLRRGYTPEQLQEMWDAGTLPDIDAPE
jgi:hypothetical protein